MFIIYDLVFLIFAIIYLPVYLFRGKFHKGFLSRLGVLPANLKLNRPIWIHAVSVGEAMAVKGLLKALRKEFVNKHFVISTVTPTGNKIAAGMAEGPDFVTYLPLDLSFIINSVMDRIRPSLFIIAETEIWPNLITSLYEKNIPVVVVNGRISDNSFKSYSLIKFLMKPVLDKIKVLCVQAQRDARRLIQLGLAAHKARVTGNMKFDLEIPSLTFETAYLRLKEEEQLLICGSTHPQEEEIILDVYRGLLKKFPDLRLLIAPRHTQRAQEIEGIASGFGFEPLRISRLSDSILERPGRKKVFILDTVGQLISFYAIADIVFVGGSFIKKGGHNIIEPASLAKPIIFGPHMFNFRDIAELFLSNDAALSARDKEDFSRKLAYLLKDRVEAQALGERARELVLKNRGATARNLEVIKKVYAETSL